MFWDLSRRDVSLTSVQRKRGSWVTPAETSPSLCRGKSKEWGQQRGDEYGHLSPLLRKERDTSLFISLCWKTSERRKRGGGGVIVHGSFLETSRTKGPRRSALNEPCCTSEQTEPLLPGYQAPPLAFYRQASLAELTSQLTADVPCRQICSAAASTGPTTDLFAA